MQTCRLSLLRAPLTRPSGANYKDTELGTCGHRLARTSGIRPLPSHRVSTRVEASHRAARARVAEPARDPEKTSESNGQAFSAALDQGDASVLEAVGTIKEAVGSVKTAVEQTPVRALGTAVMYTGAAAIAALVGGELLASIDKLPLLPQALQMVGVTYGSYMASRYLSGRQDSPAESPLKVISQMLSTRRPSMDDATISKHLKGEVAQAMERLVVERDVAVAQADELRYKTQEVARVVAEKQALEVVAVQLAGERDKAMVEVHALKSAVDNMTDRMRSIEGILAAEVTLLKEQNTALETVALQLAGERDAALREVSMLHKDRDEMEDGRKALEEVAMALAKERDQAFDEIKQLKRVVASLRAEGSDSGLTPEQEAFIKSRVRDIRSQFITIDKPYEQQRPAVEALVSHLVEEYGAPREWTLDFMTQTLASSSKRGTLGSTNTPRFMPIAEETLRSV